MTHKEVCGGNDANPNPCANGGACRVNLDLQTPPFGYICDCADGFSGDDCQDLDPCGTDPCVYELADNGCINDLINNDYTCVCLPGWSGKNCDEVEDSEYLLFA
jgi:Notch-like protein